MTTFTETLKTFIIFTLFSFHISLAIAQTEKKIKIHSNMEIGSELASLSIGDKVANVTLKMVNYTKENENIYSLKGKIVIFDFWATWCSSCISHFSYLESLQDSLRNDIQIILVNEKGTGDTENDIRNFFKNYSFRIGRTFKLPSIILDTALSKMFKHQLIPHYVWIDSNMIVKAYTSSKDVNSKNIVGMLKGKTPFINEKKDPFNILKPLFKVVNFYDTPHPLYSSSFSKNIENIGSGITSSSDDQVKTFTYRNLSIIDLYSLVYSFQFNRLILNIKNRKDLIPDETENWFENNSYCYEISVPLEKHDTLIKKTMREELNRFLNLQTQFITMTQRCYVIKPKIDDPQSEKITYNDSFKKEHKNDKLKFYKNVNLDQLVSDLNDGHQLKSISKPIFLIDKNYNNKLYDLYIPLNARDNLYDLKKCLIKQGFDLIEVYKDIEMFVISNN